MEDVLDNIERFLAAKVAALRRNESANLDVVDAPTGGLALDFAKHTDPEDELKRLLAARGVKDVVYIRSRSRVTAAKGSNPFKKLVRVRPAQCLLRCWLLRSTEVSRRRVQHPIRSKVYGQP